MKELVTTAEINRLFVVLALALPVPVLFATILVGRFRRVTALWHRAGIAVALAAPLNLLLWKIYESNTHHLGLDTVKNVLVNLVLFVVVGVIGGLIIAKLMSAPQKSDSQQPEGD
jgi:flagellar biosynthesis protein FliQ